VRDDAADGQPAVERRRSLIIGPASANTHLSRIAGSVPFLFLQERWLPWWRIMAPRRLHDDRI
jgi:hypothetical protein